MMYNKLNCVSIFGQRDEVRQQLTVKVTPLPEQFVGIASRIYEYNEDIQQINTIQYHGILQFY